MISVSLTEVILKQIFIDNDSPFAKLGFSISLHTDVANADGTTEIDSPSYSRAIMGHGEAYWALGARTASNALEIVFPASSESEVWPAARSVGLWSLDTSYFLWSVPFDTGSYAVGLGDRLVIPAGGMVVGFG